MATIGIFYVYFVTRLVNTIYERKFLEILISDEAIPKKALPGLLKHIESIQLFRGPRTSSVLIPSGETRWTMTTFLKHLDYADDICLLSHRVMKFQLALDFEGEI
ncbi:uncharacterized protein LOC119659058 [Hermetia illucens]|uniref:uncharacterized protein LOC119659058 n=1 Tax=Hermetia illucens TaxID=343691 RepID=UPI0018CC3800|nr:uncharacterized protein LOC119659058 [Hermetia illucens]